MWLSDKKSKINRQQVKEDMGKWLGINHAFKSLELHYSGIEPKIIAEKYIEEFEHVRVDFYIVSGRILFGKKTFMPVGGIYYCNDDWKPETDLMLGEKIRLF